jgi:hypothetical protein
MVGHFGTLGIRHHLGPEERDHAHMDKRSSVTDIIERLRSDLGTDAFDIMDHWPDDPHAIGIARPSDHNFLVYFCTFPPDRGTIAYECDGPPTDPELPFSTGEMVESASYADLLAATRLHLKV